MYYKVSLGRVNDWHVISGGFVRAPQTAIVHIIYYTQCILYTDVHYIRDFTVVGL